MIAALIALLLMQAPAQQFDLICTGTKRTIDIELLIDTSEPYSAHYRIDLDQRTWCEGDCRAHQQIANVGPTQITLEDDIIPFLGDDLATSHWVNRETGVHSILSRRMRNGRPAVTMSWDGHCDPAPFTGFPEFRARF